MRVAARVLGALLVFVGCVWFLQGIGVLPGSFMTGQSRWAIIGGICIVAGIAVHASTRRKPGA